MWVARRSGQRGRCYQRLTWGENSYVQPLKVNKLSSVLGVSVPFSWLRGILAPHCLLVEGRLC